MLTSRTSIAQQICKSLINKYPQNKLALLIRSSDNLVSNPDHKFHYHHRCLNLSTCQPLCNTVHVAFPLGTRSITELARSHSLSPRYAAQTARVSKRLSCDIATHYKPLVRPAERACFEEHEWSLTRDGLARIDARRCHEEQKRERRPLPRLLYIQNPFTWLANKMDFGNLRRHWDPEFDEWEFRRGAKQAISTVTQLVAAGNFADLKGLLTPSAQSTLRRESETIWGEKRHHLGLTPDDIQLALPRKVHFNTVISQYLCDIDMLFVAIKWIDEGNTSTIVYLETIARFHREYTEGRTSDWVITLFRITKFKAFPGYNQLM